MVSTGIRVLPQRLKAAMNNRYGKNVSNSGYMTLVHSYLIAIGLPREVFDTFYKYQNQHVVLLGNFGKGLIILFANPL